MELKALTAALLAALLAACGGGGGSDAPSTAPAPAAVQITSANAPTVAAHAANTTQNTTAVDASTGLASGVEVQAGTSVAVPNGRVLTQLVRMGAGGLDGKPLATGATVSQTVACLNNQGTLTVSGSAASGAGGLTAGDNISIVANNCSTTVDGAQVVMNGGIQVAVTAGSLPANGLAPFHIVITITASNLSVVGGGQRESIHGDITLDWNAVSSTSETLTASGTSLANGETTASGFHTTTWSGYKQRVTINGSAMTSALNGAVVSDNAKLGTNGGSYIVTTVQDLSWTTASAAPTGGVIKVVGAGKSALQVTFSSTGAKVQVDANGDGTYETSSSLTAAQLKALL